MEDVLHVLGAVVGDFDTDVCLICREGRAGSFLLTLREPITPGAQEKPDVAGGDPPCARGDRSCLARRDGVPHLGRHRRV